MMHATITDNIALASLDEYASPWARFIERTRLGDEVGRIGQKVRLRAADPVAALAREPERRQPAEGGAGEVAAADPRSSSWTSRRAAIDVGAKFEIY